MVTLIARYYNCTENWLCSIPFNHKYHARSPLCHELKATPNNHFCITATYREETRGLDRVLKPFVPVRFGVQRPQQLRSCLVSFLVPPALPTIRSSPPSLGVVSLFTQSHSYYDALATLFSYDLVHT